MNVKQAAEKIGVTNRHIRWLIKTEKLKARKITVPFSCGYYWEITDREVERFQAQPHVLGRPRNNKETTHG